MALLGTFREGIDSVRFRMKGSEPLSPPDVTLDVTPLSQAAEPQTVVPDTDTDGIPNNEYKNDPVFGTAGKNLGLATVDYAAEDLSGNPSSRVDVVKLISSYGRNYGEDYGNGL